MRKIMFSDKFALTQAVLDGRKTQTRRIYKTPANAYGGLEVEGNNIISFDANGNEIITRPKYNVGEVVAVAQSYKDCGYDPNISQIWTDKGIFIFENCPISQLAGWNNKLFVAPFLMPHRIRITDVRVERLNDISEADIKAEGIDYVNGYSESYFFGFGVKTEKGWIRLGNSPREAYAALIDRISSKGVWSSNPYVFVYEFELVK